MPPASVDTRVRGLVTFLFVACVGEGTLPCLVISDPAYLWSAYPTVFDDEELSGSRELSQRGAIPDNYADRKPVGAKRPKV